MESALEAKVSAIRYFEQNGTLAGFAAPLLTMEDFHATLDKQPTIEPGESYKGYTYTGEATGDRNNKANWQKND